MSFTVLPSLLAADISCFGDEIRRAEAAGADALHLDIMDGHFVPNISFGPAVVAMARKVTALPLNVHLMLTHPGAYIDAFAEAGADRILVHVEAEEGPAEVLARISARGLSAGITLNPATPAEAVFPYLELVDQVLGMAVDPGYGGQAFMPEMLPTFRKLRTEADRRGLTELSLMVDGGINQETGCACAAAGVDAFVAGTYLFRSDDMAGLITALRRGAEAAAQGRT
jgi:ribulose-phosphate 3-epimerase